MITADPEVTVASTTDSQEDVNVAAGLKPSAGNEEIKEEKPEGEEKPEKEGSEEGEEQEGEEKEEKPDDGEKPEGEGKGKGGFQKRINKLTKRARELQDKLDAAEKERDDLRKAKGKEGEEEKKDDAGKPKPKPKLADFDDVEAFYDALADWKLDERDRIKEEQTNKTEATRAQKETFDAYNTAVEEARAAHDDFDEVLSDADGMKIPSSVQVAIVGMKAKGPEVAYALAKDPELCQTLLDAMEEGGDTAALVEFGAWLKEKGLGGKAASKAIKEAGGEEAKPNKKPVTNAPDPVKPVRAASASSSVPMDELPFQEYKKARERQTKGRR